MTNKHMPPNPENTAPSDCGSAACAVDLSQLRAKPAAHEHPAHSHDDGGSCKHDHDHNHVHAHEHSTAAPPVPPPRSIPAGTAVYHIPAMDCAAEEAAIRHALAGFASIQSLRFALGARTLTVQAPEAEQAAIAQTLAQAGFKATRLQAQSPAPKSSAGYGRMGAALALALAAEGLQFALEGRTLPWPPLQYAGMALALAAIVLAGFSTYQKGLAALASFKLNINALMTVAVTGAFAIGQWPEAAMVMALYAIAEAIEARAVDRARGAISGLLDLSPPQAEVQTAGGQWQTQAVEQVALGSVVRIKPGARVPLDGTISQGASALDQSPVTGESIPADKTVGDAVFAGSINQTGELLVQVTAIATDSTLARIIHAVEQAQGSRAPTQRFVDRFAAVYTPAVFVLALAVALGLPLLMGTPWLAAAYKALVLLVIACPCALVIATPVTVVSGLATAARQGILIKGGAYLEQARSIRALALDKTGTITEGKPQLQQVKILAGDAAQAKHLALSLAARSDHPVSQAIARGLQPDTSAPLAVEDFAALTGRGTQGRIAGQNYLFGNHRLMHERGLCSPQLEATLLALEEQGQTITLLADSTQVLALFAVADRIKTTSQEALAQLHQLGVHTVMLTGDNQATAQAVATQAGIDDARGNMLPEDKLQAIQALQSSYGSTAMTGDGINDAPALAQADIGFAMGAAGTDIAMEAADILIMNDDLRRIPQAISLSRRTYALLWQNIALALGIKAVFLVLALMGMATMWMAVFADMGASLLVVFNGLRLLRK
jgi:Cd2+/Zn2+-exporting ATPase